MTRDTSPSRPHHTRRFAAVLAAAALASGSFLLSPAATAAPTDGPDTLGLTGADVMPHLTEIAEITESYAADGYRAFFSPGYAAAAEYAERVLEATGAFTVSRQTFEQPYTREGPATLTVGGTVYAGSHFDFSEGTDGTYTGPLAQPTAGDGAHTGCAPGDFVDVPVGAIVLIKRGACPFGAKIDNATAVGAGAVFVYNDERPADEGVMPTDQLVGALSGERDPDDSPAATLPLASGESLSALIDAAPSDARVEGTAEITKQFFVAQTFNVIADSIAGDPDGTVVIGAHLDGVPEGPGVNDNASGSAAILALAEKIAASEVPNDTRIRLALWSAEEVGLVGSTHYVDDLKENDPAEFSRITAYLNYDMIGSENFTVGVYDANRSTFPATDVTIPEGSEDLERIYTDYFDAIGQPWIDTEYAGRSDYEAFIANGIPAGGLFSGGDEIKTEAQAALFGGTAGVFMDRTYHTAQDTLANVNRDAIDIFAPAIGNATRMLAWDAAEDSGESTAPPGTSTPTPTATPTGAPTPTGRPGAAASATAAPGAAPGSRNGLATTGATLEGSPLPAIGMGMLGVGALIVAGSLLRRRRAERGGGA